MFNYSVILTNMGSCRDRFMTSGYGRKYSNAELFERLGKIEGVTGVELISGANVSTGNLSEIKELLEKYNLHVTSIIPDHFGKQIWGRGAFTAPEPEVRKAAVEETCAMIDIAREIGCNIINIWNGQDGYDYPLQVDYLITREWLTDGIRKCADYGKDIKISLEYKPKEPRNHSFVSNISNTLLLIEEIGRSNVGVTIDTGHSFVASENLSEAVSMAGKKGKLFHMHFNDNYRLWDDDMMTGSIHTIEYIELFYWLKKIKYDGWISVDQYPYREDSIGAMSQTLGWMKAFELTALRIDETRMEEIFTKQDAIDSTAMMRELLFGKATVLL